MKPYAWTIDHDLRPASRLGDGGLVGPGDASKAAGDRIAEDEAAGTRFLLQDEEGQLRYIGRFLHGEEMAEDKGDDWFAPLNEFGKSRGCTEILYLIRDSTGFAAWVML